MQRSNNLQILFLFLFQAKLFWVRCYGFPMTCVAMKFVDDDDDDEQLFDYENEVSNWIVNNRRLRDAFITVKFLFH